MTARGSPPDRALLAAGVLDSGLSSLATFAIGIYAARVLAPSVLGGYALVFAAAMLLALIPSQLVFLPLQVRAVACPADARRAFLLRTLRVGAAPAALAALGVAAWTLVAPPGIPAPAVVALTATGVVLGGVAPMQDHLRRMLHVAGASATAATVSAVQLAVVAAGLAAAVALAIPPWWVPLGVLASAYLVSGTTGAVLAARGRGAAGAAPAFPALRDVAHEGRWLVVAGLLPQGADFAVATLVAHLAGAATVGFAETARVSGMPLFVLAVGLGATISPRVMAAARAADERETRRLRHTFVAIVVACGAAYAIAVGRPWALNPIAWLMPKAYAVAGLLAAVIAANVLEAVSYPRRAELLGRGRNGAIARTEIAASAVRLALAPTALVLGAFAIPLCGAAASVVRLAALARAARRARPESDAPAPAAASGIAR